MILKNLLNLCLITKKTSEHIETKVVPDSDLAEFPVDKIPDIRY